MALLKPHIAEQMDRMLPSSDQGGFMLMGSMAPPGLFQATAETFNATSTTIRFDKDASVRNAKRRSLTLTANLIAWIIRLPEKNGWVRVELIQDSTGSRTVPTPTFVKADGSTAVTPSWIGAAFITESTTANHKDVLEFLYNEASATVEEYIRNKGVYTA